MLGEASSAPSGRGLAPVNSLMAAGWLQRPHPGPTSDGGTERRLALQISADQSGSLITTGSCLRQLSGL